MIQKGNTMHDNQEPKRHDVRIKILDVDPKDIDERLSKSGARKIFNRLMTRTLMFDHQTLRLRNTGRVLRLRQVGKKVFLSIKSGGDGAPESRFQKVYESELELNDFNQAFSLFESLGFTAFRYQEKLRTGYTTSRGVHIELDEFPKIPSYIEIEGPTEDVVNDCVLQIGYSPNDIVRMSATEVLRHYGVKDVDIVRFPDSEISEGIIE